jgi:hypothetical protein
MKNLYAYCAKDPVNKWDLSGQEWEWIFKNKFIKQLSREYRELFQGYVFEDVGGMRNKEQRRLLKVKTGGKYSSLMKKVKSNYKYQKCENTLVNQLKNEMMDFPYNDIKNIKSKKLAITAKSFRKKMNIWMKTIENSNRPSYRGRRLERLISEKLGTLNGLEVRKIGDTDFVLLGNREARNNFTGEVYTWSEYNILSNNNTIDKADDYLDKLEKGTLEEDDISKRGNVFSDMKENFQDYCEERDNSDF